MNDCQIRWLPTSNRSYCAKHQTDEIECVKRERNALILENDELRTKLGQIASAICKMCKGSGEYGLADGDVPCPICGGSGDPLKPGVFSRGRNP
jgi:PHP family Zn ribbon phosphoesterase